MKKAFLFLSILLVFGSMVPLGFCTGEFKEFFDQLLYGDGALIGAILIVTFCVLVSLKFNEFGILMVIPLIIMFYMTSFNANVDWSNTSVFTQTVWIWIFYILGALFIFLRWIGLLGD